MITDELTQTELADLEQTDFFEAYYSDKMDDAERKSFENRLCIDATFKQQYEFHVAVMEAIQRKGMKQELNTLVKPKTILYTPIFKYAAAACIVAIVAFGSGMFYDGATMRNLGMESFANMDMTLSRGSIYDTDMSKIHKDIDAKNFDEAQLAIDALREILQKDAEDVYVDAEEKKYHNQMVKLATDKLDWYQTILYMESNQVFKARKWLKKISDSNCQYSEDAKLIYEELLY